YTINVQRIDVPFDYGTQTTGLPASDYEVTITDAKGCESDPYEVSIAEPIAIDSQFSQTDLLCVSGGYDLGTITVDAMGGVPPCKYQVYNNDRSIDLDYDTTSGINEHTFPGLNFGDYTIVVTDANGCQNISITTITTIPDVLITTAGT